MSECNNYFLFYDRFFDKYGLWVLQDQTVYNIYKNFKQQLGQDASSFA